MKPELVKRSFLNFFVFLVGGIEAAYLYPEIFNRNLNSGMDPIVATLVSVAESVAILVPEVVGLYVIGSMVLFRDKK